MKNKITKFFTLLYTKLFKINDTPQKVALGFGLGVFLGIFPGLGPLASLALAISLKVNKASALIGCLATNTWISIVTFLLAVKTGAFIFGVNWQEAQQSWNTTIGGFTWSTFFKFSTLKILLPIFVGYIIIGFIFGLSAYLVTLIILKKFKKIK